jgi:RNA processing factor Prp31
MDRQDLNPYHAGLSPFYSIKYAELDHIKDHRKYRNGVVVQAQTLRPKRIDS